MSDKQTFDLENVREAKRLRDLALKISNHQLTLMLPNGWTVAAAFVHLAFWDLRQLALLKRWVKDGAKPSSIDADVTNEVINTMAEAIPPHAAVALAVYAAGLIDQEVEGLTPAFVEEVLKNGNERMLRRSLHRKDHLDKIEKAIA